MHNDTFQSTFQHIIISFLKRIPSLSQKRQLMWEIFANDIYFYDYDFASIWTSIYAYNYL